MKNRMPANEQGYVLLQVMFVFAILMVIVAQVQYQQRIQVERTRHVLFLSQAQAYAESAEAIAEVGLSLDAQSSSTDHLYELWNTTEAVFPLDEGGLVAVEINDLQGRFNLNWLSMDSEYRSGALQAFDKLLLLIGADESIAQELYQWFDADTGADYFYADEQPSYAPSYTAMADVTELLLLKSVDQEQFDLLSPWVSALPADSALNINTAPSEVIQTIAGYIGQDIAAKAVTDRGEEGFDAVTDFLNQDVFKENEQSGIYLSELSVTSDWFELYTEITLGEDTLSQRSVIHRDADGGLTVTLRDRSATEANQLPGDPVKAAASAANPGNNNDATSSDDPAGEF
ncbi:type II secretion system minor pseudopilin GspK [Reinekea blandensis]|uniref:Type II secretion system protein K n=1 Tax=Reinekea blandensis MED297 TaxID=314283 RepID=A4BDW9_9GAMM|nr:type II secretion system minor pseudopilin GspK [Reinekea blandensis]EAR09728.1 general secretion pathway protein K [Reinekea blandensis MED297]